MLGTVSAFAFRHRETKKNLCPGGRDGAVLSFLLYSFVAWSGTPCVLDSFAVVMEVIGPHNVLPAISQGTEPRMRRESRLDAPAVAPFHTVAAPACADLSPL